MENNKTAGECAKCGMHSMCGQHHWMHIVIKIAIAVFIFWCGVQFGEMKGMLRGVYGGYGYSRGMMGSYGAVKGYYGPSMMYGLTQKTVSQPAVATTTKTTKK